MRAGRGSISGQYPTRSVVVQRRAALSDHRRLTGWDDFRISLSDEMSLDRTLLELVLAAMAHAAGSHQDSVVVEKPGGVVVFERRDSLYPWPKQAQSLRVIDGGKD